MRLVAEADRSNKVHQPHHNIHPTQYNWESLHDLGNDEARPLTRHPPLSPEAQKRRTSKLQDFHSNIKGKECKRTRGCGSH